VRSRDEHQLGLLAEPVGPAARARDPETSKAAARAVTHSAAAQRSLILIAMGQRGYEGGIYTELAVDTGLAPVAVGRRLKELRRDGAAVRLTETRLTPSGLDAHVHVAIAFRAGRALE
jgi:hypothetical protein